MNICANKDKLFVALNLKEYSGRKIFSRTETRTHGLLSSSLALRHVGPKWLSLMDYAKECLMALSIDTIENEYLES